jgi:DNA gyrase subunit A
MLISTAGTVIRMAVEDIKRSGRATQGVIVMRFKTDDERVSALAPVVESDDEDEPDSEESGSEVASVAPEA